jgi:hypothetical protein
MAHYAKVNSQGIVEQVIVAEPVFFDTFVDDTPGRWVQTSYNTKLGVHYTELEDGTRTPSEDQSQALRANFASVGGFYHKRNDVFYGPKPHESWVLNTTTWGWEAPVAYPDANSDEQYVWNEDTTSWDQVDG